MHPKLLLDNLEVLFHCLDGPLENSGQGSGIMLPVSALNVSSSHFKNYYFVPGPYMIKFDR